jgi:hypothetical protein
MNRAWWLVPLLAVAGTAGAAETASRVNERAGLPIFAGDAALWDEDADVVAARLGLPPESRTTTDASYRLYPPDDARLFGRRPHSIALSAQDGKLVAMNIIFANKGDSVGQFVRTSPGERPPRPAQLLRDYRRAIGEDDDALDAALGDLFGPAQPEKTGSGGKLQEKSRRRDWQGHSFLLVSARDEYVALRIVPTDGLDEDKRVERVPAKELRARLATKVERRPNGDVVIGDIPMVNQGPKGFCVPATMERMLRHLGIPADMYLLAMAANTDPGGGTTVADVISAVGQTARRHGRRVVTLSGQPEKSTIGEWIEAGIPVLWAINTSTPIDDLINQRTRERAQAVDWSAWSDSLKPARREARKLGRAGDEGHVCLITGYNPQTDEIALSDSWGPGYEERWITQDEAAAISQGSMAVVTW